MRTTSILVLTLALGLSSSGAPAAAQPLADASASPVVAGAPLAPPAGMGEAGEGVPAPSAEPAEDEASVGHEPVDTVLGDASWREITPRRGPAAREDHTWTVDGAGRFAYLFGGRDGGREFGDLWRFDLRRDRWQKLSTAGRTPAPRFGHSAVWVDGIGVVVFAGQRGDRFFADLWAYDPATERWRKLPARGAAPRPRYGSCMVVGPDGRLWISHGFTTAGRFDDTRAYDLERRRWTSIAPDTRRPGERCLHDCFTTTAGDLVLYGGQDDGAFALGDLWVMGPEHDWERLADPRPRPRRLYAVAEAGPAAFVFGGAGEDGRSLGDLWRVDRETVAFERLTVAGAGPDPRYAATLISDPVGKRLLLFGGQADRAKADVWAFSEADPTPPAAEPADEDPPRPTEEPTGVDQSPQP